MLRLRHALPAACAALLVTLTARSCGPDFPVATFVLTTGPDGNYALYAAGHLGVPQPAYRTRHLVLAYDYLTHHPLPADAQQQAVLANNHFVLENEAPTAPSGFTAWIKLRATLGPIDHYLPTDSLVTTRDVPGGAYGGIVNCLDPAFTTATRTLAARLAAYGAANPAVLDWARAQDAVFSNCGDGKPPEFYGTGPAPTPPPAPHPPAPVPAGAPLWLAQDRAYQLAAAQFYAMNFDGALAAFRAIAADTTSPWSTTARYLMARTLVRKATLSDPDLTSGPNADAAKGKANQLQLQQTLTLARQELIAMRTEPRMAAMLPAIEGLLDYVNLRLQPDQQAQVLANRLASPRAATLAQSLIDLTWLRTNDADPTSPPPAFTPAPGASDLLAWIDDLSATDTTPNSATGEDSPVTPQDAARARADILRHWQAAHSTVWLVAALTVANPSDPQTPELLTAAQSIQPADPAFTAVTYHRLRLSPRTPATRAALLSVLPQLGVGQSRSTVNLFLSLNASTAPSLYDWLPSAGRVPAAEVDPEDTGSPPDTVPPAAEDVCGNQGVPGTDKLFDTDAAVAFNHDMPLRLLALAAESTLLPENLRFQVAQAAWARALLLDPEGTNADAQAIARRMQPVLLACRAAWKPVFDAYNAASTPTARHAAALLALMRFASTEPSVREGDARRLGFATYDDLRQNWWCTPVPNPGGSVDDNLAYLALLPKPPPVQAAPPPPLFLTPADLAEARNQVAALSRIPTASTYFATQALAWAKANPTDPQTPEILGEAFRVVRNACRTDPPTDDKGNPVSRPGDMTLTPNLAHALFDVLHRNYPQNVWTKRYKTWE